MWVVVWLQLSLLGHLRPLGVVPALVMVAVILAALWLEATPTLVAAIVGGLLLDMASGADFGLRTGFFMVAALAVIAARQFGLHAESLAPAMAIVVVATLAFNLAVVAGANATGADWVVIAQRIGLEALVNTLLLMAAFTLRAVASDRRRVSAELRRGSWL
jgi:cell shape-determining protein MreD